MYTFEFVQNIYETTYLIFLSNVKSVKANTIYYTLLNWIFDYIRIRYNVVEIEHEQPKSSKYQKYIGNTFVCRVYITTPLYRLKVKQKLYFKVIRIRYFCFQILNA